MTLRQAAIALGAAVLLLFSLRMGVPLLDPDEARFARTSVEMMRSRDYVVPSYNGEARLAKPPLLHWIQVFFFGILGVGEVAARLPSLLATLGSVALLGWVGARRFGPEGGVWSAAIFATFPLVLPPARLGTVDALLSVHVLAIVALDLGVPEDRRGPWFAPCLGALAGLAFLAKGPVGVVLPLLVVLAGRTAGGKGVWPGLRDASGGIAAFLAVIAPWGLALLGRIGTGTASSTVRHEVLDRFFVGTDHVEPFWYYAKVAGVGFLPWLAPLVAAVVRAWTRPRNEGATARYASAGLLVGIVFLSFSQGKLPTYLLPLAPLAALLVAWELARELEAPNDRSLVPTLVAATVAGVAAVLAIVAFRRPEGDLRVFLWTGAAVLAGAAFPAFVGALKRRPRVVYASTVTATCGLLLATVGTVLPALGARRSAAGLVERVPALTSGRPVVTVEIKIPSLVFYADRPQEVITMDELGRRLEAGDAPVFVIADVDLPSVPSPTRSLLRRVGGHAKFQVFEPRRLTVPRHGK